MSAPVHKLCEEDFDDVTAAPRALLIDFWADWCAPCKALAPAFEELARDYAGDLDFAKVDVTANPALAARFGARSIPLIVLTKQGVEVARIVAPGSKTRLAAFIDAHL